MKNRAKKYFYAVLLGFLTLYNVQAQSCQRVEIVHSPLQQRMLEQFVRECKQGRYFVEEQGIVALTAYEDAKGRQVWSMYAMIDDRYQDNPPRTYSTLGDVVILVYQADSLGRTTSVLPNEKASLNQCLEKVIENRVYRRPLVKDRFVEYTGTNGVTRKGIVRTLRYDGNYWNNKTIIFNKDGTYRTIVGIEIKDSAKE